MEWNFLKSVAYCKARLFDQKRNTKKLRNLNLVTKYKSQNIRM